MVSFSRLNQLKRKMTSAGDVTVAEDGPASVKLHPYIVTLVRWCVSCLWSTATVLLHRIMFAPLQPITGPKPKAKVLKRAAGTEHLHPEPRVECQLLHQPEEHTLDVIFVHGLYGSLGNTWRQGEWQSKYPQEPEKVTLRKHSEKACKCQKNAPQTNIHNNENNCRNNDLCKPHDHQSGLHDTEMTINKVNEKLFRKIIPRENDLITEQFYNNTLLDQVDIVDNYDTQAKFVRDLFKRGNNCDNTCDDAKANKKRKLSNNDEYNINKYNANCNAKHCINKDKCKNVKHCKCPEQSEVDNCNDVKQCKRVNCKNLKHCKCAELSEVADDVCNNDKKCEVSCGCTCKDCSTRWPREKNKEHCKCAEKSKVVDDECKCNDKKCEVACGLRPQDNNNDNCNNMKHCKCAEQSEVADDNCKCNDKTCEVGCGCTCDDCYSTCWPRDWIKMDFPGARVISINYTSDPYLWRPLWIKENKRLSLHVRAEQMMEQLLSMKVGDKPIVWVGHSKGGLFIKQMYCEAFEAYKKLNNTNSTATEPKKGADFIRRANSTHNDAVLAETIENIVGNMFDKQMCQEKNNMKFSGYREQKIFKEFESKEEEFSNNAMDGDKFEFSKSGTDRTKESEHSNKENKREYSIRANIHGNMFNKQMCHDKNSIKFSVYREQRIFNTIELNEKEFSNNEIFGDKSEFNKTDSDRNKDNREDRDEHVNSEYSIQGKHGDINMVDRDSDINNEFTETETDRKESEQSNRKNKREYSNREDRDEHVKSEYSIQGKHGDINMVDRYGDINNEFTETDRKESEQSNREKNRKYSNREDKDEVVNSKYSIQDKDGNIQMLDRDGDIKIEFIKTNKDRSKESNHSNREDKEVMSINMVDKDGDINMTSDLKVVVNKPEDWNGNTDDLTIVTSNIEEVKKASLYSQSRGFMFYSVPHRGSPLADIKTPVTARSLELLEISKDCPLVLNLHSRWLDACGTRGAGVRGFVETCRTLMSVLWLTIVSEQSADAEIGTLLGASVDHREICKPSSRHCMLYTELVDLINEALSGCECH